MTTYSPLSSAQEERCFIPTQVSLLVLCPQLRFPYLFPTDLVPLDPWSLFLAMDRVLDHRIALLEFFVREVQTPEKVGFPEPTSTHRSFVLEQLSGDF